MLQCAPLLSCGQPKLRSLPALGVSFPASNSLARLLPVAALLLQWVLSSA